MADARTILGVSPFVSPTHWPPKPNPRVSSRRDRPLGCILNPIRQRRSRPTSTLAHCQIAEPHKPSRPHANTCPQTSLGLDIEQLVIPSVRLGERSAIHVDPQLLDGGVLGRLLVDIEVAREDEVVVDFAVDDLGVLEGSLAMGEVDRLTEQVDVGAELFFPVEFPAFELFRGQWLVMVSLCVRE